MTEPLSTDEIAQWQPALVPASDSCPTQAARQRMEAAGQWQAWQVVGRRMAIGCVALEVTQRCNLDCTYCYLSESSEALRDLPLAEVMRRIDLIAQHYGPGTDVQVTGGEPSLRNHDELVQIVAYIRSCGMRASLFTNGIRASRALLERLCHAGLEDVAFHVDLSQARKGYATEASLQPLRDEYIARAKGLPLSVFFNTTVFPGNLEEVPQLVRFFMARCDVVRLAAFQLGAATGRGTADTSNTISIAMLQAKLCEGAGTQLAFDTVSAGHQECNRYAFGLVAGPTFYDGLADSAFIQNMLQATSHLRFDRRLKRASVFTFAKFLLTHPWLLIGFARWTIKAAWHLRHALVAARGRVGKLSLHIHNFQAADALDRTRCEACSFHVITPDGPLSMCVHNAKRDAYLLVPAKLVTAQTIKFWNPTTGALEGQMPNNLAVSLNRKNARGVAKQRLVGNAYAHAHTPTPTTVTKEVS
jgi:7,8-dihydro-6-hydroxymethylpterin dimethyltransferase